MKEGKSFSISQGEILIAYKKVKENKGVGGIDKVNFEDYEINLKNNLYKLWNRMSSGSYFPKPVKGVEIPKKNGKVRLLGIPWSTYRVVHCYSENHAKNMMGKLDKRMKECGLEIHPEKSKIVYCRNSKCNYDIKSFDFLGYTFRNRSCKNKNGKIFTSFTPAVSNSAGKSFRSKIKDSITRINTTSIEKLAEILNPIIRGWMNYFTKYNPSHAFRQGINYINLTLIRWLRKTRKRVRNGLRKAQNLLNIIFKRKPLLFYHWKLGYIPVK